MLTRLEALGYVEARAPLSPTGPERKTLELPADRPLLSFLVSLRLPESQPPGTRTGEGGARIVERDLDTFMGLVFEDCCREWAGALRRRALRASQQLGSWWSRNGQIEVDVVGASRGRYDLLGSCKWDQAAPAATLTQLLAHREALPKAGAAQLVIFVRGFSPELKRRAKAEGVALIGIDRLFRGASQSPERDSNS